MLFAFNVRAFSVAVLLIRKGLCTPLETDRFKFFFLSGILGELAWAVLSLSSSDFVFSISIVYSASTIFFIITGKKH